MSYDVVVIGAGSVGTPAAFYLAREGLKVLVLDRLPSPGQGSNKAAIGGVRATHSDPAKIRLGLRTIAILTRFREEFGREVEWRPGGYVFVAYRPEEERILKELVALQRSFGLNIRWCEADELLRVVPDLNPQGLRGGTYSPEDGHCSPLLLCHAYYELAKGEGAEFRFREEVVGMEVRAGRVQAVRTDKGRYPTALVLNAAGAWAAQIGKLLGVEHPVYPDCHEAGITEPVAHFLDPMIVDIRPGPGSANCYFHQLATGQIAFCLTPEPPILGEDRRETSAFLPQVARRIIQVVPRLAGIRVRRTWRGLYPMTPDGLPLVGWVEAVRGYLVAIGLCGQGVMLGPALGELLARLVLGTPLPEDQIVLRNLSPERSFARAEVLR
ncbi:MAG: FAD-binding oxidoreductase [Candidatus Bipolaricaulota bacterium]|nr:FAD-binding oxidoreductase [Candidatus Bipolaricaulota bacterium]MCX7844296.1 FAD-binding oxidoreductase [Candidatus Bipolaricaulota bacterium]MDW8151917.1 FAD-binding oxidoreductase [Candidatus Bipolaricaulota bacterium]